MKHRVNGHVVAPGPILENTTDIRKIMKAILDELTRLCLQRRSIMTEMEDWLSGKETYADSWLGKRTMPDGDYLETGHGLVSDGINQLDSMCETMSFEFRTDELGWYEMEREDGE